MMKAMILTFALLAAPAVAQDITVQFNDSAPKDRIVLINGHCPLTGAVVTLELEGSQGGLIFDVTAAGSGVEVFQPVEITQGIGDLSPVTDGDTQLQILVGTLAANDEFRLTADLDDTLGGNREITVTGSEIAGATVSVLIGQELLSGTFDAQGTAVIAMPADAAQCAVADA